MALRPGTLCSLLLGQMPRSQTSLPRGQLQWKRSCGVKLPGAFEGSQLDPREQGYCSHGKGGGTLTEAGASLLPVDVSVLAVTDFFGS